MKQNEGTEELTVAGYLLAPNHPLHVPPHVALVRVERELNRLNKAVLVLQSRDIAKAKVKAFEGSWLRVFFIMGLIHH